MMRRAFRRFILVVALWLFFALALGAALDKSPTNDEPVHLTRGAALSQSGDLSLQYEHPPLSHRLIGALLPTDPTLPAVAALDSRESGDRPAIAREFMWENGLNVERALLLGRLPIVWVGLLLGAAVALWTTAATRGDAPALAVVMALYATSPNLLASAALATTDFAATATSFATVCAWWFYCRRTGWGRWVATGVLLGLALAAKLTGVLLLPILAPLAYVYPRRGPWWRPGVAAVGLIPVAALALWAVYGFQLGPWRGVAVPAPAYWESWESVLAHVSDGHQAFFLGRLSSSGWWSYFPVAFLLKTPIAFLGLLGASLVAVARDRGRWRVAAFALLPVWVFFAAAVISRLNIGYRHILPVVPFLLVTIGLGIPALWRRPAGRWGLGLATAWALLAAVWVHPDHLAYFNEFAGGPGRGYRFLGDSNLDWGQDLGALAKYAATYDGTLFVSYGGAANPAYYGLDAPALAGPDGSGAPGFHPANPAPGRYAISAGHLQGLLPEADLYDWFRRREPAGSLGYSILLYDVEGAPEGEWIAQCAAPAPILSDAEAGRLVGREGARPLAFDCASSWVFPNDGAPGWYVLPEDQLPPWVTERLGEANSPRLVYRHDASVFGPAYAVFYWPGDSAPGEALGGGAEPLLAGGAAELRGVTSNGDDWFTVWRVARTTSEPLSIQAHLLAGDGPPRVADGLGFPSDQWRPGDWFIQRHVFDGPGQAFETGLYNYVTLDVVSGPLRLSPP